MKTFLLLTSIVWLGFLISCDADLFSLSPVERAKPQPPDSLPPLTFEGLNTLGFEMNGELFAIDANLTFDGVDHTVRRAFIILLEEHDVVFDSIEYDQIQFQILANTGNNSVYLSEGLYTFQEIGIDTHDHSTAILIGFDTEAFYCEYFKKTLFGELNLLHYDREKHIVSGTFAYTVIVQDDPDFDCSFMSDTLYITNGRFDLKYYE